MNNRLTVDITTPDRCSIGFFVRLREKRPTCFALGVRKSASSLFSNVVNAMAMHNDQANVVDVPGEMFKAGYKYSDWNSEATLAEVIWGGNVYIGFRDAPTAIFSDPVFKKARKILLVRDPRDVLVSEYFSNAYSHSIPEVSSEGSLMERQRKEALDSNLIEYVTSRVIHLNATVEKYGPLLDDPEIKLMRYEDVILQKRAWLQAIAEHFEFDVDDTLIDAVLSWADVVPEVEDEKSFVRRVVPGDHKNKLTPETIAGIGQDLDGIWHKFGYDIKS